MRGELKLCLYHPRLAKVFTEFAKSISSAEAVAFVREIDNYRIILDPEARKDKYRSLTGNFLNDQARYSLHIDAGLKTLLRQNADALTPHTFDECQDYVLLLMQNDVYPKFLKSAHYKNYQEAQARLAPEVVRRDLAFAGTPRMVGFVVAQIRNLGNKGKEVDNVTVKMKLYGAVDVVATIEQLDEQMSVELQREKTKTIKKPGANPSVNEEFTFLVDHPAIIPYMVVKITTKDSIFQETVLGSIMISVAEMDAVDGWTATKNCDIYIKMQKMM